MDNREIIVIGDIHGVYDEFRQLLDKIKYDPIKHRVILVGDLIDRAPFSKEVVQLARELGLEATMGNHDYRFLRWFKGNKYYDEKPHYTQMSDEDVTYLNNLPYYIKAAEDLIVVHAGIKPGLPIEQQRKEDMLYLRYTNEERKRIPLRQVLDGYAPMAKFWTEFGPFGNFNVVYGHEVHSFSTIRVDRFGDYACYGIDTGAVFGGKLSALNYTTGEIIQVQSKEYYKPWKIRD